MNRQMILRPGPWMKLAKYSNVTFMRRNRLAHRVVILVAVLSLAVAVATRYCSVERYQTNATKIVKAHSFDAKRQRLLNDGLHWAAPAETLILFEPTQVSPAVVPAVPPVVRLYLEHGLHNRPPPFC
jgi:hypothetical protein